MSSSAVITARAITIEGCSRYLGYFLHSAFLPEDKVLRRSAETTGYCCRKKIGTVFRKTTVPITGVDYSQDNLRESGCAAVINRLDHLRVNLDPERLDWFTDVFDVLLTHCNEFKRWMAF